MSAPIQSPIGELEPSPGEMLGRYELLLPLAAGGMGKVWIARLRGTRGFRKLVAIKTIQRKYEHAEMEQMLLQEATLASQVHHPNVVETLELGEQQGVMYLVMELVHGESLRYILQEAFAKDGVPLDIAVNIVGQTCKGLQAVHELTDELGRPMGLVHRDISPANILVTYSGTVKIADFGVATTSFSAPAPKGEIKGKISYLAPEQVKGSDLDARVDVFTTAIVLYLMTARRHPFKASSDDATLRRILDNTPATPPSSFLDSYPPALELVLLRGLAKRPEDRWQSASEFLSALNEAMPEAFGLNSEKRTADFLHELLKDRIVERRETLRTAESLAEESGSRTAVVSALPAAALTHDPREEATPGSRSRTRRWMTAGGLVVAAAAVAAAMLPRGSIDRSSGRPSREVALTTPAPSDRGPRGESNPVPDSRESSAEPDRLGSPRTGLGSKGETGGQTKLSRAHLPTTGPAKSDPGAETTSPHPTEQASPSPVWLARPFGAAQPAREGDSRPSSNEPGRGPSGGAGSSISSSAGAVSTPSDPALVDSSPTTANPPSTNPPTSSPAAGTNGPSPFAATPPAKTAPPRMLPSRVAHALLAIDPNADPYRVRLEAALEHVDQTFAAAVQICVSVDGNVTAVTLLRSAAPSMDGKIQSTLSRWRYRPFVENGQARPFCYALKYEIGR